MQGKFWKMLVDFELDKNNLEGAISLFSECLLNCYHVPLWLSYMRFIKMVRASTLVHTTCSTLMCRTLELLQMEPASIPLQCRHGTGSIARTLQSIF